MENSIYEQIGKLLITIKKPIIDSIPFNELSIRLYQLDNLIAKVYDDINKIKNY